MPDWWRLYQDDKGACGTQQSFKAEFGLAPDVIEYVWTMYLGWCQLKWIAINNQDQLLFFVDRGDIK